jgi:hypothetical protein
VLFAVCSVEGPCAPVEEDSVEVVLAVSCALYLLIIFLQL